MPSLTELAQKPAGDGRQTYGEVVHFVHVLVIEPHPQEPDVSPYGGRVWEGPFSTVRQPTTYEERWAVAEQLSQQILGDQLLLIDELSLSAADPVWCTYGPAPNSAYLIAQDGIMLEAQLWLDTADMARAIERLLE